MELNWIVMNHIEVVSGETNKYSKKHHRCWKSVSHLRMFGSGREVRFEDPLGLKTNIKLESFKVKAECQKFSMRWEAKICLTARSEWGVVCPGRKQKAKNNEVQFQSRNKEQSTKSREIKILEWPQKAPWIWRNWFYRASLPTVPRKLQNIQSFLLKAESLENYKVPLKGTVKEHIYTFWLKFELNKP